MEFKGTKGKWKLHKHAFACVASDESSLLVSNCGGRTSNINAGELYIEQQANALLISKAPEMLYILQEFLSDFDNGLIDDFQIARDRFEKLIKEAIELK